MARALAETPRCDHPLSLERADLLADLERVGQALPEAESIAADLPKMPASPGERVEIDVVIGRHQLVHDAAAGSATLLRALAAAEKRHDADGAKARSMATLSLALERARTGAWGGVVELLARAAGDATPARCAVAVAVDVDRSVVVARGADGGDRGLYVPRRSSPLFDQRTLVPGAFADLLAACPTVSVYALPPVAGLPQLLPPSLPWAYRVRRPQSEASSGRRLIVSGVEPPARLELPHLPPWARPPAGDVEWLGGAEATPARVLAALESAGEALLHVHGLVDLGVSDASFLVLSPGSDGGFALTAGAIGRARLRGHPIVVLGACHAAQTAPYLHEPWSLPLALLDAGARAVIASPGTLPDADAARLTDELLANIAGGDAPAAALRDLRLAHRDAAAWLDALLIFD